MTKLELVSNHRPQAAATRVEAPRLPWAAAVGIFAFALAASGAMHWHLGQASAAADARVVQRAEETFSRFVAFERRAVLSEVSVLADDTRVRATVMTPNFDEATVKDVLQDLKRSSGASVLAVLDVAGKVRAVVGADGLRGADLGASPVVTTAMQKPNADVWTFPEQVLVVGVAPVRSGPDDVAALFMMGFEIGHVVLDSIHGAVGAAGAVLIRDRLAAASVKDPATTAAFRAAGAFEDAGPHMVRGDRSFVARIGRTSESAAAAKTVWLVERDREIGRIGVLRGMIWTPAVFVAAMFALFAATRRRAKGAI